jgi:hypothetical protein
MNIRTACFAALVFTVIGGAALFAGANANARDTTAGQSQDSLFP